jgi:2-polyprenyl-6-methoxyphenol hydroxylase-like FAD-dependent oxidoreductase
MDLIGLSEEFVRRGYPALGLNVGLGTGKKPISVEMQDLVTRFPYLLVLPQGETEEILEARLNEHGVAIERGVELVGVEQRGEYVVSRVCLTDGSEEQVRSRYLVGCDGAHSAVRSAIKLPFELRAAWKVRRSAGPRVMARPDLFTRPPRGGNTKG